MTFDLKIDPTTGDLCFNALGELETVSGEDGVAQEIQTRLRWWRGEHWLDTSRGVPYLEDVLVKGVTEATVREILLREILSVPGVLRVASLDVTIDRGARHATVRALDIETDEGPVSLANILVGGG